MLSSPVMSNNSSALAGRGERRFVAVMADYSGALWEPTH
jgi:hypothetical protein